MTENFSPPAEPVTRITIQTVSHLLIVDPQSGEVLINQRDKPIQESDFSDAHPNTSTG